jgi:hypothetical protein
MKEKKVKSCSVCPEYQRTKVMINGENFDACKLSGAFIPPQLAKEQAVCKEY